jgi:hypothetical protein
MCVGFCRSVLEPGKFNYPTLLIVVALKLWHATVGLYMWVLTVLPHVAQINPPCLAGNFSLPLTTNGRLFEAVTPTGGRYGSVIVDDLPCYLQCSTFELIHSFGRSTPPHGWPLLWA